MGYRRPIDSQLNRLLPVKAIERDRQLIRTCAVGFLGRPFSRPSSSHQRLLTSGQEKASNVSAHGQARIRRDYPAIPLFSTSHPCTPTPVRSRPKAVAIPKPCRPRICLNSRAGRGGKPAYSGMYKEIGDRSRRRGDDFRLKLSIRARPPERVFDGCFHRFHALIKCPGADGREA